MKANSHKKNHSVPRFILKYWETQSNGRFGVHLYSIKKGTGIPTYRHFIAPSNRVDRINYRMALMAREWLVSDNRSTLEKYVSIIHSKEWKDSLENENRNLTFVSTNNLTSGWGFPESNTE